MSSELETNIVAVERIKEYSDLPKEAPLESNSLQNRENWPENGNIEIKNFNLRYDKDSPLVLKDVNLKIKVLLSMTIINFYIFHYLFVPLIFYFRYFLLS